MHVHLAQLFPSLVSTIAYAYNSLALTEFSLDCGTLTGSTRLYNCALLPKTANSTAKPAVKIITKAATASAAMPFLNAFGTKLDRSNTVLLFSSALVFKVPLSTSGDAWAVVTNPKGPAECFFRVNKDCSLWKACGTTTCPPGDTCPKTSDCK
jgi:hypothetical protein